MDDGQVQRLDDQDRHSGTAAHQKGFVAHHKDKMWRQCTPDEQKHGLCLAEFNGDLWGEPTTKELEKWSQLGLLPPGRGGRAITRRKDKPLHIHHVGHDASKYEADRIERIKGWTPNFDWVPGMLAEGQKYFLILCSGHRRWKDLATFFWWESSLVPICIDITIDAKWGDLLAQNKLWISLIHARKVAGGHAGPPCETFSFARWLENQDSIYPRPLRNDQQPWGMDGRTLRETFQYMTGNFLFWQSMTLLLTIYAFGGSYSLEHPKGADKAQGSKPGKWSVWDSSFVRQLLLAGDVRLWTFLQGPLGQPFPKPTSILAARLPGLGSALYAGYDPAWRATATLGGRENGQWRTSKAKAYPAKLCQILAQQHIEFATNQVCHGCTDDPPQLQEALHALANSYDPYLISSRGTLMGADFHFRKASCD